jgi:hypothetical protein
MQYQLQNNRLTSGQLQGNIRSRQSKHFDPAFAAAHSTLKDGALP